MFGFIGKINQPVVEVLAVPSAFSPARDQSFFLDGLLDSLRVLRSAGTCGNKLWELQCDSELGEPAGAGSG